jgi:hypothetical protein
MDLFSDFTKSLNHENKVKVKFDFDLIFMFNVYLRSFKTYSHNIWYADDCYADASLGAHVSLAYAI